MLVKSAGYKSPVCLGAEQSAVMATLPCRQEVVIISTTSPVHKASAPPTAFVIVKPPEVGPTVPGLWRLGTL